MEEGKQSEDSFDKNAYNDKPMVARVYIINAEQLVTDNLKRFSAYLKVRTGRGEGYEKVDIASKKERDINPAFYKVYELKVSFPSNPILTVELWDENVLRDSLIGSTNLDLSFRYFSEKWQKYDLKPIERRSLWNPVSSNPQGLLKMWVEILSPEDAIKFPPLDISPPKPMDYELRCIVWEAKGMALKDKANLLSDAMSDIFVSVQPDQMKPQKTDIHWRSQGEGKQTRFLFGNSV